MQGGLFPPERHQDALREGEVTHRLLSGGLDWGQENTDSRVDFTTN